MSYNMQMNNIGLKSFYNMDWYNLLVYEYKTLKHNPFYDHPIPKLSIEQREQNWELNGLGQP
jgi:hypothetical protein